MTDKPILVVYASQQGSTHEVAEAIGKALQEHGAQVEVRSVKEVTTLAPYRAAIVGSAIHAGKWLPQATEFVKKHKSELAQLPLIYFLVCATLREDTPEHHGEVLAYLDPVRAIVEPLEIGLFAGKMDAARLPFLERMLIKVVRTEDGDWRDWEAIHEWAGKVRDLLETKDVVK